MKPAMKVGDMRTEWNHTKAISQQLRRIKKKKIPITDGRIGILPPLLAESNSVETLDNRGAYASTQLQDQQEKEVAIHGDLTTNTAETDRKHMKSPGNKSRSSQIQQMYNTAQQQKKPRYKGKP